jgi:hypothetical protein
MARYLILFLYFIFFGCEINSQQIIKPEKFNYDEIKFNAVSKNLIFKNLLEESKTNDMKKIINYWFDNKVKTDGFSGLLEVIVKDINISQIKEKEYYKFLIDINIEFIETSDEPVSVKTYTINANEYGEINGIFSINDQEIFSLNIMYQALNNISNKIKDFN